MRIAALKSLIFITLTVTAFTCFGQQGTTIELKKPKKYQNRTLASEKTTTKKIKMSKRLWQDLITHYNYYFNANNRMNAVVDRAKLAFKEDYSSNLLPFYDYTLSATAADKDIDSIVYKCHAGILLHDLRSDWVDNMYLLLGETYFYRKRFDSAAYVFQYINYAFAPKDDGYDIPIGSNESNTDGVFSVSTKEDRDLWQRITSLPPSRNDALLWQARTYVEAGKYAQASGMLEILRHDPNFPKRLLPALHETIAYWYYKQNIFDSSAAHLSQSIDNSATREERARREYVTAQMYLMSKNNEQAIVWYDKAAEHATDPVLNVYAILNSIDAYADKSDTLLQKKIESLTKLAKKDRYIANRDIIYYAIAKIEIEKKDVPAAKNALQKSVASSINNPTQKSRSFLMLADVDFDSRDYVASYRFYDSVSVSTLTNKDDVDRVKQRIAALKIITQDIADIHKEDSLQAIAALPKPQMDVVIKKVLKRLLKEEGLREDALESAANVNPAVRGQQNTAADLFAASNSTADWYFNNQNLKTTGYNAFTSQWGNRPNVDNWRIQADVDKQMAILARKGQSKADSLANAREKANGGLTFDALYKNLPTTPEKLKISNDKIAKALFNNGKTFENTLEDYPSAIAAFDSLLLKYPGSNYEEESLFNLYYCYTKTHQQALADSVKALLAKRYNKGKWNKILQTGAPVKEETTKDPATERYEEIYNLFIQGDFEKAKEEKSKADSVYGSSHWSPQLLYIESIYYVSKRQDSVAINRLNSLVKQYPLSPMADRAKTMISVLKRRKDIENYLTNLQITRYKDDEILPPVTLLSTDAIVEKVNTKADSTVAKPVTQKITKIITDTVKSVPGISTPFKFNAADSEYVSILLTKVDPVFANEAGNAFNRYNNNAYYMQRLRAKSIKLDDSTNIVLIGPFVDAAAAVNYIDKTRPVAPTQILPWLSADKFMFSMISPSNLGILQQTKDLAGYKKLLQASIPGKF